MANGETPLSVTLPGLADMHVHFRQDAIMPALVKAHLASGHDVVLAMPNTLPPVSRVSEGDDGDGWSIEGYRGMLMAAGADAFGTLVTPLYLTKSTTAAMISRGRSGGLLQAVKYYPPHGTTNSDHGLPLAGLLGGDVLRAMEAEGVTLCIHGERHGVTGEAWFGRKGNAEEAFYGDEMLRLRDAHPGLRISCEHITTRVAVEFVRSSGDNVGASVTPMHLTHVVGHLLQGWFAHLKCMPLVKFEEDVEALRKAVADPGNRRFYAGTDSAPHPQAAKSTDCGCASGCFTGNVAPQMYAEAFELAGVDLGSQDGLKAFRAFMSENGPDFHRVTRPARPVTLVREPQLIHPLQTDAGEVMPLPVGMTPMRENRSAILPWRLA